jgi:hypothetical protein
MGENENKESAMASTEENKSKSKKAKPKASKPKAALNEIGLPMRPKYDCQVGIRLNEEERAALIARCQKEGHHSLSNCIRVVLGFEPLR